jgi:hypothetical protein
MSPSQANKRSWKKLRSSRPQAAATAAMHFLLVLLHGLVLLLQNSTLAVQLGPDPEPLVQVVHKCLPAQAAGHTQCMRPPFVLRPFNAATALSSLSMHEQHKARIQQGPRGLH